LAWATVANHVRCLDEQAAYLWGEPLRLQYLVRHNSGPMRP
jgi:hypothetical protein